MIFCENNRSITHISYTFNVAKFKVYLHLHLFLAYFCYWKICRIALEVYFWWHGLHCRHWALDIESHWAAISHSHIGISCYRLFRAKQTYFLWIIHAFKAQSIVWWVFFNESLWSRHIPYNIQHFVKRGGWQCTPLDLLSRSGQKVHVSWYMALHSAKRVQFLRSTWRLHTYLDLLYLLAVIQVKFYQTAWQLQRTLSYMM